MRKTLVLGVMSVIAMFANACGEHQLEIECVLNDTTCVGNKLYICQKENNKEDSKAVWKENKKCDFGCNDQNRACKCDTSVPNRCEMNGIDYIAYVCSETGDETSILCANSECTNDGKCGCSKCILGCGGNADGACKLVDGCDQHDQRGACICINGNNDDGTCKNICMSKELFNKDGSCACPEKCDKGCNADGACVCPEDCKNGCDKTNGLCLCPKDCLNGCGTDGSCTCPDDCASGCFDNGLCKVIGNCSKDADCNEYGYCGGNICYCKESKCLLNDANGNHMYDYLEVGVDNKECGNDSDCVGAATTGEKFCDNAMGYKCSIKCGKDSDCVDGFICRKSDGRCVSEYFTTVWDKEIRDRDEFSFHVESCPNGIEVCWDWKDGEPCDWKKIDSCSGEIKHEYDENGDGDVTIKIKGELNGVNFYDSEHNKKDEKPQCAYGCTLLEVQSFGQAGFSLWYDKENKVNRGVFEQCYMLKNLSDVDIPDPGKLKSMSRMFLDACSFNSPIEQWDVSNVNDMWKLFSMPNCVADAVEGQGVHCFNMYPYFNQPLNRWNVSNVINMDNTFHSAVSFNQPLDRWDVSNVTNMSGMFAFASLFNYPIGGWNVSRTTDMSWMFYMALSFNQDISMWKPIGIDVNKYTGEGIEIAGIYSMLDESGMVDAYIRSEDKKNENLCKLYRSSNWRKIDKEGKEVYNLFNGLLHTNFFGNLDC